MQAVATSRHLDFDQTSNLTFRASFMNGKNFSERKCVWFSDSGKGVSSEDVSGSGFVMLSAELHG
jgi:hypothetical protein